VVAVSGTNQYKVKPLPLVTTVAPPILAVFSALLPAAGALEAVPPELAGLDGLLQAAITKAAASPCRDCKTCWTDPRSASLPGPTAVAVFKSVSGFPDFAAVTCFVVTREWLAEHDHPVYIPRLGSPASGATRIDADDPGDVEAVGEHAVERREGSGRERDEDGGCSVTECVPQGLDLVGISVGQPSEYPSARKPL